MYRARNESFRHTFMLQKYKQLIKFSPFLMCFPHRRSPSAFFEGTHGVRFAWGNTDAIDFVAIASSLQATNGRRAVGNTNRLKAVPLRFVRQLRTQTAQSLVLSVKLGARFLAAVAARVPSFNRQRGCISRQRTGDFLLTNKVPVSIIVYINRRSRKQ